MECMSSVLHFFLHGCKAIDTFYNKPKMPITLAANPQLLTKHMSWKKEKEKS
jgi:hypothetical protein